MFEWLSFTIHVHVHVWELCMESGWSSVYTASVWRNVKTVSEVVHMRIELPLLAKHHRVGGVSPYVYTVSSDHWREDDCFIPWQVWYVVLHHTCRHKELRTKALMTSCQSLATLQAAKAGWRGTYDKAIVPVRSGPLLWVYLVRCLPIWLGSGWYWPAQCSDGRAHSTQEETAYPLLLRSRTSVNWLRSVVLPLASDLD